MIKQSLPVAARTGITAHLHGVAESTVVRCGALCRGELLRTWGHTTYPVEYEYDALGRKTKLRTFRTGDEWDNPSWDSASDGNDPEETTWVYQGGTGLLLEKQYDGHDPEGPIRNIEYQYTD